MELFSTEMLSVILSSLGAIAVVFSIVFEGKLKNKTTGKAKKNLINDFLSVTFAGWGLIVISILMSVGNGSVTYWNLVNTKKQYKSDTTRIYNVLTTTKILNIQLRKQRTEDSNKLSTINEQLVINAEKLFKEQQRVIEKEKENVFIHLQEEVATNLAYLLYNLSEETVNEKLEEKYFPSIKLANDYIDKYQLITDNKEIIKYLMLVSGDIQLSNSYLQRLSQLSIEDLDVVKTTIVAYNEANDNIYHRLGVIYFNIYSAKTYKDFENIGLNRVPKINKESLKESLFKYVAIPYTGDKTIQELKNKYGNSSIIKKEANH